MDYCHYHGHFYGILMFLRPQGPLVQRLLMLKTTRMRNNETE